MANGVPRNGRTQEIIIKVLLVIVGILAGSSGGFILSKDYVTKPEVTKMIETNAPYIQDRRALNESLTSIAHNVRANGTKIDDLGESLRARVGSLETRVTQLEVKVDLLLEKK